MSAQFCALAVRVASICVPLGSGAAFFTQPARKRKPLSDDSESCETSEMRRKVSQPEKISVRQYEASPTGMPSGTPGTPAKSAPPERRGDLRGQASAERDPLATSRPQVRAATAGKEKTRWNFFNKACLFLLVILKDKFCVFLTIKMCWKIQRG